MERKQFTFYRSYWNALRRMSKTDRLALVDAIVSYALDQVEPDKLTPRQEGVFYLIQPTLDAGRRKAENAMQGKGKTKRKQTENKKEIESESELELKKESEIDIKTETDCSKAAGGVCVDNNFFFHSFWQDYPCKIGVNEAMAAWEELDPDEGTYRRIMDSLHKWRNSPRWQTEGGRYVPTAGKFLSKGYWQAAPAGETMSPAPGRPRGILGQTELDNIKRLLAEG